MPTVRSWDHRLQARLDGIRLLVRGRRRERVIVANTVWLTAALGVSSLADFLVVVYVTRVFGAAEYGKFAFALAFASLFASFFDFGLALAVTREFARDPHRTREFPHLVLLKALLGLAVLVPITAGALVISPSRVIRALILVMSLHIFMMEMINLCYALFRSRQRMDLEARFRFLYGLTLGVLVVGVMAVRPSVMALGIAYAGTSLTTLVTLLVVLVSTGTVRGRPALRIPVWRQFLGIGAYLALGKVAGDIIAYAAPVMLGALGRVTEAAWYNAAAKVYGIVLFPMSLVASVIFPALVTMDRESGEEFGKYWTTWARSTVTFAVLLCAIVVAEAAAIVAFIFPPDFAPAASVLRILIVAAALIYLYAPYYHALLIFNEQRKVLRAVGVGACLGIVVNALLIPRFGPLGAAWAIAVTHFVIFFQLVVAASRYPRVRRGGAELVRTVAVAGTSGALVFIILSALNAVGVNVFLSVTAGVTAYVALMAVFTGVRRSLAGTRASHEATAACNEDAGHGEEEGRGETRGSS